MADNESSIDSNDYFHVVDQYDLPKINIYGLTPKPQEDETEKLFVFRTLQEAKRYNKNRLGGIILKFNYRLFVERDNKTGYLFITTTIPTNQISVFIKEGDAEKFIPFEAYYREQEETNESEAKTASKLRKIAARIHIR